MRFRALDGLRGIAAFVVMLHHLYLIAQPYLEPDEGAYQPGTAWWWLSATPLKLLTVGSEAVLVFFVLSGFVVPLPALRGRTVSWSAYFASRAVRLLIPVWAAIAFAATLAWVIPRDPSRAVDGSWLDDSNAQGVSAHQVLQDATLSHSHIPLDNVLWSLRWELAFSALLPLFAMFAIYTRRWWPLTITGCFVVTVVGQEIGSASLEYLPVFLMGTIVASRLDDLKAWCDRHRSRALWAGLFVASLAAILADWLIRPLRLPSGILTEALGSLAALGGVGLVLAAVGFGPVRRALERPVSLWLGRYSFSLYLVHVPIIATLAYVFGDWNWWLAGLVGVPLSLLVAWGFGRWVEQPTHRLAKRLGSIAASVARRVARMPQPDLDAAAVRTAADTAPAGSVTRTLGPYAGVFR